MIQPHPSGARRHAVSSHRGRRNLPADGAREQVVKAFVAPAREVSSHCVGVSRVELAGGIGRQESAEVVVRDRDAEDRPGG
jgi:hypothetical protein